MIWNSIHSAASGHWLLERLILASVELLLLALCVEVLLRIVPRCSARMASWCWTLVFVKPVLSLLLGGALLSIPLPVSSSPPQDAARSGEISSWRQEPPMRVADSPFVPSEATSIAAPLVQSRTGLVAESSPWRLRGTDVAIGLYVVGLLGFMAKSLRDRVALRRIQRRSRAVPRRILDRQQSIARELGLRRLPPVRQTDELDSPALAGTWKPVVFLPAWMVVSERHSEELPWVLRHEMTHLVLHDPWLRLIREIAQILFFFHPAIWWAGKRWGIAAELACDRALVRNDQESHDYAQRLLDLFHDCRVRRRASFASGLFMLRSELGRRVAALVQSRIHGSARFGIATTASFAALATLALSVGAEFHSPSLSTKESVTIRGRVLQPDGKPCAGATIHAARYYWDSAPHVPLASSMSDADGRFAITYDPSQIVVDVRRPNLRKEVMIAATKKDCGPAWIMVKDLASGVEPTLRLVEDEVPICGRLLDLEGRPIRGVEVHVKFVHSPQTGDLDPWLLALESGAELWMAARNFHQTLPGHACGAEVVVTDAEGKFTLTGIGAERVVELFLQGSTIAIAELTVITREREQSLIANAGAPDFPITVYGAEFTCALGPSRPVEGVVRDAKSKMPLPRVCIESYTLKGFRYADTRIVRTFSDEAGRFRLIGLPKGDGNSIVVTPNDDQPFFVRIIGVPNPPGLTPVPLDVELHAGIWISGRVTDQDTGEGLEAHVLYQPFLDNPHSLALPDEFQRVYLSYLPKPCVSSADGAYRLVGLPGRGVVAAECIVRPFRNGVGIEEIEGLKPDGSLPTWGTGLSVSKRWPQRICEIRTEDDAVEATCDLSLDPGLTVAVDVVDPEGLPVAQVNVDGDHPIGGRERMDSPVRVLALAEGEERVLVLHHPERQLGKVIRVQGKAAGPARMTATLEPCGTVCGRLLDQEGEPVAGATLWTETLPAEYGRTLPTVASDASGCFSIPLMTGSEFMVYAQVHGSMATTAVAESLEVEPGESKDLGDVRMHLGM